MSGPANLIPLQLDQTSGNLVAKQISGIYVPPTGTGFQYVTNGSPSTTAVTPTQATALLNLFTSSLQGLVPASGGGTTNFLRADGTWASPVVSSGVTSFNTRTGAVTLTSADIGTALGYTAYNGTLNPSGFLTNSGAVTSLTAGTGISVTASVGPVTVTNTGVISFNTRTGAVTLSSSDVTTALTFTPYNATNPAGYITGNQTITLSGDISGSGTTAITATLPNIATAGTYGIVTVNAKGQVTSGSSPTTLAGYGITDGVATDVNTTMNSGISLTFQGGGTVYGIATPVNATDAANKAYVDAVAQGLSWKAATKAATTVNLSGTYVGSPTFMLTANPSATMPTIDGYAPNVGDRLLVKNQTTQSQNGIYVVTQITAPWILTRSTDFDETTPIDEVNGAAVYVEQGTTQSNTTWTQTNNVTTFDVSPITWTQFSSGSGSGTVTSVAVTGNNGIGVSGSPVTTSGTVTLSLGAITPTSVLSSGTVQASNIAAGASVSGTNTGDQTITLTGDITGSGTGSFATTLATVNASPGSYNFATVTVNGKGLITSASSGATPVTSIAGTTNQIVASASTGAVTLSLAPSAYISTALQIGGTTPGPSSPDGATFQTGGSGGGSGFAIYSTILASQGATNYSLGFDGSNTSVNGTNSVTLCISGSPVLTINSAGGLGLGNSPNFGTSGQVLTSQGTGAAPTWTTVGGSGTVTNVTVTGANGIGVSGSPITTNGTIALSLGAITPTSVTTGAVTFTGANSNAFIYLNSGGSVVDTGSATNGQLLIGSTGNAPTAATLTAGTGISVVNGAGSITINNTGVTSVALASSGTYAAALSVTGSPVTTTGTLTITPNVFTSSAAGVVPASGGGTTNFLRADGTWAAPSGGGGSGTVTNVSVTAGTGITASVSNPTTTPNISIAANGAMGTGGAGTERVVWQYTNGNFTNTTPTSTTSGVSVSNVTAGSSTATYAFTGYDHPPAGVMIYGMVQGSPPSWVVQDIGSTGVNLSMADTGTNSAPNLITSFTSSNSLSFQMPASASQASLSGVAYLIIEFKF